MGSGSTTGRRRDRGRLGGRFSRTHLVRSVFLHRPRPPGGALVRDHLNAALDRGIDGAATVVSAPAGFGKSVIVSQWCETLDRSCAWLSLDDHIDDPRWFVLHLAAAVRSVCPDALGVTSQMARAARLPDQHILVTTLSNELDELAEPVVIVLDDYQKITSPEVHSLMSELLRHPSESAHFVIVGRHDPPLPTGLLRARGQLNELRMNDLAFSGGEIQQFTEQFLDRALTPDEVSTLRKSTEGWPAGVRLAAEAMGLSPAGTPVVGASFLDRGAQAYLVGEVLEQVPPEVRRYLLAASIFDRFSAPLCDAVVVEDAGRPPLMTGDEFIGWLRSHNLFIIQLDAAAEWFRFHHVFARLLDNWRRDRGIESTQSEARARRTAAHLFQECGLVEEAIEQLGLAGDRAAVATLAEEYGSELIEEERWVDLERLLSMIPQDVVDSNPSLLLLRAWLFGEFQSRHSEMRSALDLAEQILDRTGDDDVRSGEMRAQIAELRGAYSKLLRADFDGAIVDARTANRLLAHRPGRHLAFAYVLEAIALAGAGRSKEAHQLADSVIGDERFADAPWDPLAYAMPYLGWLEGDLDAVDRHSIQLLSIGERFDHQDTIATAHYFLGISAYERNRLHEADEHLGATLDLRLVTQTIFVVHAEIALGLSQLAQGRGDEADDTAAATMQYVLDERSEFLQPVVRAFLAELDLRRGRHASALRWAQTADLDVERHRYMFYDLTPTLIGALLTSPDDAVRGSELLEEALEAAVLHHHVPLTVSLLGLRALRLADVGEEAKALDALKSAVALSQQAGMVRRLADLGPALVPLLSRLDIAGEDLEHAGAIVGAIGSPSTSDARAVTPAVVVTTIDGGPTLTGRELDVLRLLAHRLSNKEIARELFIAPATVKKRTVTLYDKLNVHGRHEAVAKARILGYLSD